VKKIALTLIAVSALGLAACNKSAGNNTSNEVNSSGPAVEDTNGAINDSAMNDLRANASGVDTNGSAPANDSADNGAVANETTK
jgi:hypothetical protein